MERQRQERIAWERPLWIAGSVASILNSALLVVILIVVSVMASSVISAMGAVKNVAQRAEKVATIKGAAELTKESITLGVGAYRDFKARRAAAKAKKAAESSP